MRNETFLTTIPIIRDKFNSTKSAKFKGVLKLASNKHGIVYDWKIEFSEVFIDLFTTEDWIKKGTKTLYKFRESLFNELGLKQEVRPEPVKNENTIVNKIIELNALQIEKINSFFNDRKKYDSTIKNIVGVLKGNSPGGEASKPDSAEMVVDSASKIRNFVILVDDLIMKKAHRTEYNVISIGAKEIRLEEFVNLNEQLKGAFEYMQVAKDYRSWAHYLENIKEYYKKYNEDFTFAERLAKNARSMFYTEIKQKVKTFPWGLEFDDHFQRCHIYEYHSLRDLIVEAIRCGKSTKKFEDMIKDVNNFLPLPYAEHHVFDRNQFTYKTNGEIWPLSEEGRKYIDNKMDEKFKKIPEFFLTSERIKYIEKRNMEINYID